MIRILVLLNGHLGEEDSVTITEDILAADLTTDCRNNIYVLEHGKGSVKILWVSINDRFRRCEYYSINFLLRSESL